MTTTTPKLLYGSGSVSHATLRTEDLLESLGNELEWQVQRNGAFLSLPENMPDRDRLNAVLGEWQDLYNDQGELIDDEQAECFLNETLFDALSYFAAPYFYFGAHPGDGSDFGYWLCESFEGEFDGLKVNDTSEVPPDYSGEVLHVSDHGNLTLYAANQGELTEVWGVV